MTTRSETSGALGFSDPVRLLCPKGPAGLFGRLGVVALASVATACSNGTNFGSQATDVGLEKAPDSGSGKGKNTDLRVPTPTSEGDAHAAAPAVVPTTAPVTDVAAVAQRTQRWTFDLAETKAVETGFDLATGQSDRVLEFTRLPDQSVGFEQPNRATGMLDTVQGSARKPWKESFSQRDLGLLDVLVVIDNSGSMKEEQTNLSTKLSALVAAVDDANWQIGVITTDPAANGGGLRSLVRKTDADREALFKNAVTPGIAGSGNERGVLQAVNGLKAPLPGSQGSWLRTGSAVGVLIVSDEDNCSKEGYDCAKDPWKSETYLIDFLKTIRTVGSDARVYGIFGIPNVPCATAENVGVIYKRLVDAAGGSAGSICSDDFSPTLRTISNDLKSVLKLQYQLSAIPEAGSLKVSINGVETKDYTLKGDVIEFPAANPPPANAAIEAVYIRPAMDYVDRVVLPEAPGSGTLTVTMTVDGKSAVVPQWGYDAATRAVTFASYPPEGAKLAFRWKRGDLRKDWDLGDAGRGLIEAVVLDAVGKVVDKSSWTYNATLGRVSFTQAPIEGASFTLKGNRGLRELYDLPETAASAKPQLRAVGAYDEQSMALSVTFAPGSARFRAEDVVVGKKARIVFTPRTLGKTLPIDAAALKGSAMVWVDDAACEAFEVRTEGLVIDEAKCAVTESSKVRIAYAVPVAKSRIPLPEEARTLDAARFEAAIDGKPFAGLKAVDGFLVLEGNTALTGELALTWAGAK